MVEISSGRTRYVTLHGLCLYTLKLSHNSQSKQTSCYNSMDPSCGSFSMTLLQLTLLLNSFAFLKFAFDIITEIKPVCLISHGVRGNLNNNNNSNNKNASLCLYLVNSLTDALFLKY